MKRLGRRRNRASRRFSLQRLPKLLNVHLYPLAQPQAAAQRLRLLPGQQHAHQRLRGVQHLCQRLPELGDQQLEAADSVQHRERIPSALLQEADALAAEDLIVMAGRGASQIQKGQGLKTLHTSCRCGGKQRASAQSGVLIPLRPSNETPSALQRGAKSLSDGLAFPTAGGTGQEQMLFHAQPPWSFS